MSEWTPKKYKPSGRPLFGQTLTEEVEEPLKPTFKAIPINNPNVLSDENYRGERADVGQTSNIPNPFRSIIKPGEIQLMPEQTVTAKPSNIPLRDIPLTDAQRQIGMKIPQTSAKDANAENERRLGLVLGAIQNFTSDPVQRVIDPIKEGAKQGYEGISQISGGENAIRGTGNILGGAFKTILGSLPPVMALNAVQPIITKSAGDIGEKLGVKRETAEDIANKITPFIFGLPVGIGSLASEETVKLLDDAGAFKSLSENDQLLAKDLIQNGLFLGIAAKGGKLIKKGKEFRDLIKDNRERSLPFPKGKTPDQILQPRLNQDQLNQGLTEAAPTEKPIDVSKLPTKEKVLTPYEQARERARQRLAEIPEEQKSIFTPEETQRIIDTASKNPEVKSRNLARALGKTPDETTIAEIDKIKGSVQKVPEVPKTEQTQTVDNNKNAAFSLFKDDKSVNDVSKALNISRATAIKYKGEFDKSQKPFKRQYFTPNTAPENVKENFKPSSRDFKEVPGAKENVPKELYKTLEDGTKVYLVDGNYIRNNIDIDNTMGGHEYVYPKYIPKGEVWLDKDMAKNDLENTLRHELTERTLMRDKGLKYDKAHEIANKEEIAIRRGEKPAPSETPIVESKPTATKEPTNLQKAPEVQTENQPQGKPEVSTLKENQAPEPKGKEPWKLTKENYSDVYAKKYRELKRKEPTYQDEQWAIDNHKYEVDQALKEGKTVPENVLADYPDLAEKYKQPEEPKITPDLIKGSSELADEAKLNQKIYGKRRGAEKFADDVIARTKIFNEISDKHARSKAHFSYGITPTKYVNGLDITNRKELIDFYKNVNKESTPTSLISEPEKTPVAKMLEKRKEETLNLRGTKELTEQSKAGLVENDKLLTQLFQQKEIQNSKTSRPVEKIQASAKAKKIVKELNAKGVKATYDNRNVYIDGKKISSVDLSPRVKVEDVTILNDKAAESFENLSKAEVAKQTALASIVEPKDLDTGLGQKTIDKGLEQIKKDDGQEMQPEAQAVRDAALQKEKLGVQIGDTVVKGDELVNQAKEGLKETPELARAKAKLQELQDDVFSTPEEIKKAEEKITQLEKVKPKPPKEESLFEGTKDNAPVFRTDEGIKAGKGAEETPLFSQPKEDKAQIDAFKEKTSLPEEKGKKINIPKDANAVIVTFKDGKKSKLPIKDFDVLGNDFSKIKEFNFGKVRFNKSGGIDWNSFVESKKIDSSNPAFAGIKESISTSLEPKQEPIKASNIISQVEKDLGVPIRIGKVAHRNASAFYKQKPEVIRMREANDLNDMSHEIAHHIDKKVLGGFAKGENKERFAQWDDELKLLDYDKSKKRAYEGFAEYVRHYLTRDDAAEIAPRFNAYFENDFLPNNPKIAEVLSKAKDSITKWREQGSLSRVISQIDFDGKKTTMSLGEKFQNVKLKAQTAMTDRLQPIRYAVNQILKDAGTKTLRPSEDPYQVAMSVQKSSSAKAREFIMESAFDFTLNKVGKSLKEIVEPISKDYENAIAYAYAKHGKSLHERGINPGISLEDADYILKNYSKPEYEQFSKDFTEWSNHLVDYLVDAGGLSKEAATRMREVNPFYIPLKRSFAEGEVSASKGQGFVDLPSPIKRIKGSGREIINPLESMIAQTEQIIAVADKARVARALADLTDKFEGTGKWIEKVPAPMTAKITELENLKKQIEQAGGDLSNADMDSMITLFSQGQSYFGKDNIVSIYRDGKREYFQLHPLLFDAMKGLDKVTLPWFIDYTFGKATRMVRLGATGIRAGFSLITNPIRDAQTFALQSEHAGVRPDKIAKAIFEELRGKSEYAREFRRAGGEMSQPLGLDRKMLQNTMEEILSNDVKSKSLNIAKHPIEALRKILSFPESGTRLAEFEAIMDKYKPKFEEAKLNGDLVELKKLQEDATVEASNAASEVTVNFKRAGSYSAILNQIIPFFNPAIQGISRMGRTIYEHPVRSGLRATAILTAPTLALWYLNKDEDWYKNLPDWQKYAFWNFKVGDTIVRLPKPFEWGYVFAGIPEGIANSIYQKDPKYYQKAISASIENLIPDITPALIKPAMESYFNWDMFRERPIVSKSQEGLLPEQQFSTYTSELAKTAGEILGVSPSKIDHLLSGYTGGLANDILNALPKEYKELADIPIAGRLFTRESAVGLGGQNVQDFYNAYQRAESLYRTINNAEKNNKTIDLSEEDENYLAMRDRLRITAEKLSLLRKKERAIDQGNFDYDIKKKIFTAIQQSGAKLAEKTLKDLLKGKREYKQRGKGGYTPWKR